jgi:hypothetical protein
MRFLSPAAERHLASFCHPDDVPSASGSTIRSIVRSIMLDIIMLALACGFFAVAIGYVFFCEKV